MKYDWKPEYFELAERFLILHFGSAQGVTKCFPCMRDDYPWGKDRPDVFDSRVPAKNNTEYHGLERHACQYYATAQYEFAYHHWLLAAFWRKEDMDANCFDDEAHHNAIQYCIKQALYNKALHLWQQDSEGVLPTPDEYELTSLDLINKEEKSLLEIENYSHE